MAYLLSGRTTSWALQSPLVRRSHRLCSLAGRCHWLDSATEQGCRLGSAITPGWVRPQDVLPYQTVLLARLHVWASLVQARLCGWTQPQAVFCDQVGP